MLRLFVAVTYLMIFQPIFGSAVAQEQPCALERSKLEAQAATSEGVLTFTEMTAEEQDAFSKQYGKPPFENAKLGVLQSKGASQVVVIVGNCIVGATPVMPYDLLKSLLGRRDA
jgi:hypothetical protein